MEEESRTSSGLVLSFLLTITTRPSLVKFEAKGTATVVGGNQVFDAALEVDSETNVPKVLHTIYQHVFTSLFLVSTLIDAPYPPPDLIHTPMHNRNVDSDIHETTWSGKSEMRIEDVAAADIVEQEAEKQS